MSEVELRGVKKRYGAVEAIRHLDLNVEKGQFCALLGPSGCGKSTLLRMIAGLEVVTEGQVLIDGKDVTNMPPAKRRIAMVFQSYALYPHMTVRQNISFSLRVARAPKELMERRTREVAKMLQLEELLDRRPAQLSGGQRQRVAIGRALVREPQVFLFDEPLSNLDAMLRVQMRTEIKRLHQMLKTTVVYVTHDQIEAMTLATRIAVMHEGQIEQLGTPEEIYNRPATLYVAGFVGAPPMNMLQAKRERVGLAIDGAEARFPLPARFRNTAHGQGAPLVAGIRPEALHLAAARATPYSFDAIVESVELTGPELLVAARLGAQRITASLPPRTTVRAGETHRFTFDEEALHLFDPATGRALDS
jgi:multiple sugar transport system ATP-binding protein